MDKNTKEPKLEGYGLNASSYEDFRIQKNILEKEVERIQNNKQEYNSNINNLENKNTTILFWISGVLGFLIILFSVKEITFLNIIASIIGGIFLGIYPIPILGLIIGGIFNISINFYSTKCKELKGVILKCDKNINNIKEKIELLKNEFIPFEEASVKYYTDYLEQYFNDNLYRKRSGNEKFEQSLSEFSDMINETDVINKKLIFRHISTYSHKSYLEGRQINHNYQKSKKFNAFDNVKIKTDEKFEQEAQRTTQHLTTDSNQALKEDFWLKRDNNIPRVDINNELSNTNKKETIKEPLQKKNFWAYLTENTKTEIDKANNAIFKDSPTSVVKKDVIETIPPEKLYRTPRKIDWDSVNKTKALTGLKGEEIVMELEKDYLKSINRLDLAEKVRHVSKEIGDGLGYDVLSYFPDGKEKYIEVKSTIQSGGNSFYLSKNELDFLKKNKHQAHIYRIFNVNDNNEESFLRVHLAEDILSFNEITPVQYVVKME